jgi:hypothetical protein
MQYKYSDRCQHGRLTLGPAYVRIIEILGKSYNIALIAVGTKVVM